MTEGKKREPPPKVSFDLGLGGLFKGLGDFIDLVGDMVETGEELNRTGEFQVKGLGDRGRGVYGFSVRTVAGGPPKVERFGNIRSTAAGPVVVEVREPLVDLFDEGPEVVVVAELPGVAEEEIRIAVQDDILSLETSGERQYAKEILLPGVVDAATLRQTYHNGILELRIQKAP
ncbi:MAG: Hsp20/alpha crystallin family protein [Chloroflexi bacterium]|nr:Hsp20/alpha crystallin family protein [Chloroflexota bacterium]MBU1746923.1 Hsp20/alpha crystallin family protein [Chloroflexota bacterium]